MENIVQRMLDMNVETASAVMVLGTIEVILGIEIYRKLSKSGQFEDILLKAEEQVADFIDEYVLELLVNIPFLENRIRSHRLTEKDIHIMSAKGFHIFDGDKGRFVKEIPQALLVKMV